MNLYSLTRRYWMLLSLVLLFTIAATALSPSLAVAPAQPTPAHRSVAIVRLPGQTSPAAVAARPSPRPAAPTPRPAPAGATAAPVAAALSVAQPAPAARPGTLPRIGLQVGHWKTRELPDELARLRTSSGAIAAGLREVDLNLDMARRVAALLQSIGLAVDVLPATVPPGYQADAFVAIHADGSRRPDPRGFKLATPWRTSRASQLLHDSLVTEYASATGLPQDGAITVNMRGYYAFTYRRHTHAIARTTPAVILEMGFLTNPKDRAVLSGQPDRVAIGIANGIIRYLNERDPNDRVALEPPEFPIQKAIAPGGVDIRAAPGDLAQVLAHIDARGLLVPIQVRDGWYQVVYARNWRIVGWVRTDQVQPSGDPLPVPPATDS